MFGQAGQIRGSQRAQLIPLECANEHKGGLAQVCESLRIHGFSSFQVQFLKQVDRQRACPEVALATDGVYGVGEDRVRLRCSSLRNAAQASLV